MTAQKADPAWRAPANAGRTRTNALALTRTSGPAPRASAGVTVERDVKDNARPWRFAVNTTVVVGFDRTPSSEFALHVADREADVRSGSLVVITAYHRLTPPEPASPTSADTEATARKAAEEIAD